MPTCDFCQKDFPNRVVIEGKSRSLAARRFCLDCSPFGANNRKDLCKREAARDATVFKCSACGVLKPQDQFYSKGGQRAHERFSHCKVCHQADQRERLRAFKKKCVEYKGGACIRCGYNRCLGALDFHHRDPAGKDFGIGQAQNRTFGSAVQAELDKCDLLCSNCHREAHEALRGGG